MIDTSRKPNVETFQTPFELDQMLALFDRKDPARVLEIGSWQGGTLWHWLQTADHVVAIDDAMRFAPQWNQWAEDAGADLQLLLGRSQDPDVVVQVFEHGPYGWVLIDGDHTYEAVKADWDNYSRMVEPGGIVCFHDILPRHSYGVAELWAEIKTKVGRQTVEIVETSDPDDPRWGGIGVVFL